jgi:hypothetical protein
MNVGEVTLTLPRERAYHRVAELVLGGLAARHDVTLEALEDLEIAVSGVLDRLEHEESGLATVRLSVVDDEVRAVVGPLGKQLHDELTREARAALDLRRLLDTVVDRYELVQRDDGEWVELTKAVR